MGMINKLLEWFKSLFWKEEMELTLVGLQHAGKTTFVNVIASGNFNEDMIPNCWIQHEEKLVKEM